MEYKFIELCWNRKSTRKNSKWNLVHTNGKILREKEAIAEAIERNKKQFEIAQGDKEIIEDGNKITYKVVNGLKKYEVVIIKGEM